MANQKVIYLWCFLIQFGLINTNWAVTSDTLNHKNQPFKRFAIGYTYSLLNPDFNSYIPLGLTLDFHVNRKWSCSAGAYANYFTRSKSPTMVVAGYQVIDTIEFGYGWPSATLSDRKEYLKYLVFASLS
ncbi:MAG TPA: hypothetical protein PKY12_07235, partial [Catalimonadaceae bacterium]|nr:hypothetical protein [Catalimonadaceae bacterium]